MFIELLSQAFLLTLQNLVLQGTIETIKFYSFKINTRENGQWLIEHTAGGFPIFHNLICCTTILKCL